MNGSPRMTDAIVLQWMPAVPILVLQWEAPDGDLDPILPDAPLPTVPTVIGQPGPPGPPGQDGAASIPPILDGGFA